MNKEGRESPLHSFLTPSRNKVLLYLGIQETHKEAVYGVSLPLSLPPRGASVLHGAIKRMIYNVAHNEISR